MFHKVLLFPHSVVVCLTSKRSVDNRKRTVSKRESGGNQTFERKSGCRSVIYMSEDVIGRDLLMSKRSFLGLSGALVPLCPSGP